MFLILPRRYDLSRPVGVAERVNGHAVSIARVVAGHRPGFGGL
jgi:hypothetical protein